MKIAQISTCWYRTPPKKYGGTETVVSYLTEQLVLLGHDVTLFATGDSVTNAWLRYLYDTPTYKFSLEDELLHVVKAYEYIAQSNFDIIHNHTYLAGPALLSLSHIPNFTTYHVKRYEPFMYYHKVLSQHHRYVSISQSQQVLIPELTWVGKVHNAIKVADFPFQEKKEEYLLFIGNIDPWKSPHLAIHVAKSLRLCLKIAGPIQKSSYFEQEIAPFVDGHMIEYVGEVDFSQKVSLYRSALALLMPVSGEEPFGIVIIEALACGTPVVAFPKGAIPEIIVHGEVGFLVQNVEEMVLAVKNITSISPRRCREHVERYFDVQQMAQNYLEIYQKIIEDWA